MKRLILLTVCLLSVFFTLAQVAEPQINKGTVTKPKQPTAPKKAEVYVTWKGSETQNFTFKVMSSKEESTLILKPNQTDRIQLPAGYVTIESRYKGTTYYSSLVEVDPGEGRMVLTISGKDILVSYESEEDIREKERQAELARQDAIRKKESENRKTANEYIDKAYDYIRNGNCDRAQTYYNSATSYMSSSEALMEQLYNSIKACRSHNAYEIAMDEAKGHKRNGYLSSALSAYQKALSYKSGDYEASKAITAVQSDMNRAGTLESEGDRYFNAGNYSQAYSSYNSAVTLWSAKTGLTDKRDNAYYRMNKALGKAAFDRGDYTEALNYFAKAKEDSRGKNDSDIKQWEKEANYEMNKEKGERAAANGDYFSAYEYFRTAKSYKSTTEIQELEKDALKKTFEQEWSELVRKDNIDSYERFLKRWSNLSSEKESYIYKRLYELEYANGRARFLNGGGGSSNFYSALNWLGKYDPSGKMAAERRSIRRYLNYDPEPRGFSAYYSLPLMFGYSMTDTREDLSDVNTALPFQAPAQTNIVRSGFTFFNRFNGGADYRDDILLPMGKGFLALPYSFSLGYQNILAENSSMTDLHDDLSDGYSAMTQYQAYKDSIAAYKGENSWSYSNLILGTSIGYKFINANLSLNLDLQFNLAQLAYNSYQTCTDCGANVDYGRNFLSTGLSLNWKDRLVFTYRGMNGLVRGDLDNPENTARLLGLELKFGDPDSRTRFSFVGQWYSMKTYQLGTTGAEPMNSLQQFRLIPTFTFRF